VKIVGKIHESRIRLQDFHLINRGDTIYRANIEKWRFIIANLLRIKTSYAKYVGIQRKHNPRTHVFFHLFIYFISLVYLLSTVTYPISSMSLFLSASFQFYSHLSDFFLVFIIVLVEFNDTQLAFSPHTHDWSMLGFLFFI